MPPDLSVIILNWNTAQLTHNCLEALSAMTTSLQWEIIVVDNASWDDSAEQIQANWPNVKVVKNGQNLGFAGGNNVGIQLSNGRLIALLNSDTLLSANTLHELAAFLDSHPDAGAVSPRLVLSTGEAQPFAFGDDPTPTYLLRRALNTFRQRSLHNWGTNQTLEVGWVSGACLMTRRVAIKQIGLLDENFFMYFEDNDWCLRLRQNGWKVFYYPGVTTIHLGGQSRKLNPTAQVVYDASLRYFYTKHYSRLAQLWLALFLSLYRHFQPV